MRTFLLLELQRNLRRLALRLGCGVAGLVLACSICPQPLAAAEAEVTPLVTVKTDDTNSLEILRSYLQLQEQLHATQLAIEENRKAGVAAAAQNAEALTARLQAIEQALTAQRTREWEALQSSNRTMVTVAIMVVALGFAAMLLMAYSHWRAMNRLGEIAAGLPAGRALGLMPPSALGPGGSSVLTINPPEASPNRLLGTIDRLEKRIAELEQATHSSGNHRTLPLNELGAHSGVPQSGPDGTPSAKDQNELAGLLGKGQSLLNADKPEEALACFDRILALNARHAEALVKKGTALERLRKNEEAIQCYDRAIEADGSMTIAYLCKGGLFNRLERFNEAIECYEKALRTQEKNGGS
jgi:tetratricopeptide (TPR) repeat protein